MNLVSIADAAPIIDALGGLDGASWAQAWGQAGREARREGDRAVALGDVQAASAAYLRAHGLYFLGRFPMPNHPQKLECAQAERETYLLAGKHFASPISRLSVPFNGRDDEGSEVVFLYRRPAAVAIPPVVVMWGGVDAWKEQMTAASDAFLAAGIATVALDGPGTGESPVKGGIDAERQFLPVFDWIAEQPDLIGRRVGCLGRSFGGYWATKLAHLWPDRILGAVNWGGGVHGMFQRDWLEASRFPESYPMEMAETRSRMLGSANDQQYIEFFRRLSLLDQGLLDRPCAPVLLVNGKEDRQCPIEDMYLLMEHGSPKSVRLFPGGHMGITPQTLPTIVHWLARKVHPGASQ